MSEKSPTIPTSDDRIIAALSYIGGLFGLGPIVPIFVFLLRGKDSPFVRFHSAQAQAWSPFELFFVLSWGAFAIAMLGTVLLRIIAAVLVFQGRDIRIPLLGNWVDRALGPSAPPSLG